MALRSSIGSGVAVAAGFCAFGLGEETVSSGRSPASNNALVAYTPSWGVVPSTGNWPLHPYRDVVVPHTRTVADLREVLAVIAGADDRDVWRQQDTVDVSAADAVAARFRTRTPGADPTPLDGLVVGVPTLYVPAPGVSATDDAPSRSRSGRASVHAGTPWSASSPLPEPASSASGSRSSRRTRAGAPPPRSRRPATSTPTGPRSNCGSS
ncbi:amidase family protein [Curtobacterium flaccumfaciens]|nr:amidase family protein [Curtobacterium flaccumfaciens]